MVPLVGPSVAAAGLATLGRMIALVGELGDAALAIYGLVEDPNSAIYALFGALLQGSKSFHLGAVKKRGMMSSQIAALGSGVSAKVGKVDGIKAACLRST